METIGAKVDVVDFRRVLHRFEERNKNLPMTQLAEAFVGAVDDMFESEGASGTEGKWQPMAQATVDRHPRRAGGRLLQDTGATANIQIKGPKGGSQGTKASGFTLVSPTAYSRYLVDGTEHMPARDFFALRFNDVMDEFADDVLQELV